MPDESPVLARSSFDIAACAQALGALAVRFDIDALATCDSTNTRLMARAEAGAPSGSVVVTDIQTTGRGRRGRTWISAPGDSLAFSLLWRFPAGSSAPEGLSLAVGLALHQALAGLGLGQAGLKWPNDLLLGERKLAGVLVELQPGDIRSAVIGIGINLRQPANLPADLVDQTADLAAAGFAVRREILLAAVLTALSRILDRYGAGGFAPLRAAWQDAHLWQGRAVRVSGDGSERIGRCLGVDSAGALQLDTADGPVSILAGDVSLRLS